MGQFQKLRRRRCSSDSKVVAVKFFKRLHNLRIIVLREDEGLGTARVVRAGAKSTNEVRFVEVFVFQYHIALMIRKMDVVCVRWIPGSGLPAATWQTHLTNQHALACSRRLCIAY